MNKYFYRLNKFLSLSPFISKVLFWLTIVSLSIGALSLFQHRMVHYFLPTDAIGDESAFINSFTFFIENGWKASLLEGTSPMFNLFVWPFYLIVKDTLLAIKFANLFCLLPFIFIWSWFASRDLGIKGRNLWLLVLFLLNIGLYRNVFFRGYQDVVFSLFLSVGFIFLYRFLISTNKPIVNLLISGCAWALALSVRELFFLYVPGVLLIVLIGLYRKQIRFTKILFLVGAFVFVLSLLHLPRLVHDGKLSFLDKEKGPEGSTWTERRYLQISNHFNKGNNRFQTWEDVINFKKIHGDKSLPKNQIESMLKSPVLTVKNLFYIMYLSHMPFLRQFLFLYLFLWISVLLAFYRKTIFSSGIWIPILFFLCFTFVFSILMMGHVEFRWFLMYPFMLAVFAISLFNSHCKENKGLKNLFYINFILIGMFNYMLLGVW